MSATILAFQPRESSALFISTTELSDLCSKPAPIRVRGLASILANVGSAINSRTNRLMPGYRAKLSVALNCVDIAVWTAGNVIATNSTPSEEDVDAASDACDALDRAWSVCLQAGEQALADQCSLAAEMLQRDVQRPLWIASMGR